MMITLRCMGRSTLEKRVSHGVNSPRSGIVLISRCELSGRTTNPRLLAASVVTAWTTRFALEYSAQNEELNCHACQAIRSNGCNRKYHGYQKRCVSQPYRSRMLTQEHRNPAQASFSALYHSTVSSLGAQHMCRCGFLCMSECQYHLSISSTDTGTIIVI